MIREKATPKRLKGGLGSSQRTKNNGRGGSKRTSEKEKQFVWVKIEELEEKAMKRLVKKLSEYWSYRRLKIWGSFQNSLAS